jgi:hypothetical protein
MTRMHKTALVLLSLLVASAAACGDTTEEASNNGNNGSEFPPELEVCDPANGPFSATIDNPFLPMAVGDVHVIEGLEAGEDPARTRSEVLDETQEVFGVVTRVVMHKSWEGDDVDSIDELVAESRNYFAQAPDGTVCSFGEDEDVYEDGEIVEVEAWAAGEDGALPSIAMPGAPAVGLIFIASYRPEDDEVESSEITALGESYETPAGTFDDVMTVVEEGPSIKRFARDVGEIFDDGLLLTSY